MNELLTYQIKAAVVIAVFYLFYRLLIRREHFYHIQRMVLIASVVVSFLLPLCVITTTQIVTIESGVAVNGIYSELSTTPLSVDPTVDNNVAMSLFSILGLLYGLGVMVTSLYWIMSMVVIRSLVRRSVVIERQNNINIYQTDTTISPCSWFNNIIIPKSDLTDGRDMIVAHERAHVEFKHSWDVLFMNLCCAVQWFNPAVWLLSASLKEVHEYQADQRVLNEGFNAKQYQLLLIKKAVGNKFHSIANSLNHSNLKNRITMMLSKKSSSLASRLKLLYILPIVGGTLAAFAEQKTIVNTTTATGKDSKVICYPIISSSIKTVGTFGNQQNHINGTFTNHSGVDFQAVEGTSVVAAMDGVVLEAGFNNQGKGNRIILSHADGYQTEYAHLSSCDVVKGDSVKIASHIGKVGKTGKSTGAHLHFEVRKDNQLIDPMLILETK